MDGMFGQNSFGGTPFNQFSYFPHGGNGGDYSQWGTPMSSSSRKSGMNHGYDEYYPREPIGSSMYDHHVSVDRGMSGSLKHMEQGMGHLSISSDHAPSIASSNVESKDLKSGMGNGNPIIDHHLSNNANVNSGKKLNSPGGEPMSQPNSSGISSSGSSGSSAPKKMTWASVASQPAKPQPKIKSKSMTAVPMMTVKPNMDIGTWEMKNGCPTGVNPGTSGKIPIVNSNAPTTSMQNRQAWTPARNGNMGRNNRNCMQIHNHSSDQQVIQQSNGGFPNHPVLDKLRTNNNYNPKEYDPTPKNARFFIIKSYSEDDIHRSIKYSIWCSAEHGNKRLDAAFKERDNKGPVFLFYSVNGSGHFCGMAQMMSPVDYNSSAGVWAQDKWKGQIKVKWIFVKDVPNSQLRHIRLENNENKPVTNSRNTQEVPYEKGKQVLRILIQYKHTTSIFDDFGHYEKRQEEDDARKIPITQVTEN